MSTKAPKPPGQRPWAKPKPPPPIPGESIVVTPDGRTVVTPDGRTVVTPNKVKGSSS